MRKLFIGKIIYLSYISERPTGDTAFIAARIDSETGFPANGSHIFQTVDDLITQFRILNKIRLSLDLEAPAGVDRTDRPGDIRYRRYETLELADIHKIGMALGKI